MSGINCLCIPTDLLRKADTYDFDQSIQGDKRWSNLFDIGRLKTVVPDFDCQISIKEGLQRYLDYMAEHPDLAQEDPQFDQWCDQVIAAYHTLQNDFFVQLAQIEEQ